MTHSSQLSRKQLESKYRLYKRLTAILAVVALFLGLTVIAQLSLSPNEGTGSQGSSTGGSSAEDTHDSDAEGSSSEDSSESLGLERLEDNDPRALGPIDAPIVLVQFTDLRCPYCAAYTTDTLPSIINDYVDTEQVRIETTDVAFFGEQSENAAVAARAAGKQDKYHEFIETVFAEAPERGHPDLPRERLIALAEKAGVPNLVAFSADLDDPVLKQQVQADTEHAHSLGVNSVPFFVVGRQALSGAQPIDVFRNFLNEALEGST